MKKVWKFPCAIVADGVVLEMPRGAEVLTLQMQSDDPCVWALCDPAAPKDERRFRWVGTGHPLGFDGAYVGTVQVAGGSLVFHLFEVTA